MCASRKQILAGECEYAEVGRCQGCPIWGAPLPLRRCSRSQLTSTMRGKNSEASGPLALRIFSPIPIFGVDLILLALLASCRYTSSSQTFRRSAGQRMMGAFPCMCS